MKSEKQKLADERRNETIAHLWSCYAKDRTNTELRNRLVEHYTPLVQQLAQRYIRRYRLREVESAIGDALMLLMLRLVPNYDGQSDFRRWARICIHEKMLDRRRQEAVNRRRFVNRADCEKDWPEIEAQLIAPDEPGSDVRFAELTKALPTRDAAALWLRFYRHVTLREIATALGINVWTTDRMIRGAVGALRQYAEEKGGLRPEA
jgi:RNA polymerase sigma factor (sigma-70 family)